MGHFVLVTETPEGGECRYELVPDRAYRLGSMGDNDIVLPQRDVSRHHAVLRVHVNGFHITDLNSKNGTFVNGQRVRTAQFHCGDHLLLSSAPMVLMELSSGSFAHEVLGGPARPEGAAEAADDDTRSHRGELSAEDLVALLEELAKVARTGEVGGLLVRCVERFDLTGIVVLFRDARRQLALSASAGDVEDLVSGDQRLLRVLRDLSSDHDRPSVREVREDDGLHLLVTSMADGYLLALRVDEAVPSVTEVRAIRAAVTTALAAGRFTGRDGVQGAAEAVHFPRRLGKLKLAEALEEVERWRLALALDAAEGNKSAAARELGVSRAGLFKKMRRFGLASDHD